MPDSSASPSPIQTEGGVPENIATTVVPEPKGSWEAAVIKLATLPFQAVGYLTVKPLETVYLRTVVRCFRKSRQPTTSGLPMLRGRRKGSPLRRFP